MNLVPDNLAFTWYGMGAEADTPLARGYLPLAHQATMELSGIPHSREAGRQLMIVVRNYLGGGETGGTFC